MKGRRNKRLRARQASGLVIKPPRLLRPQSLFLPAE
ncbi:hypothetical protein KYC_26977 [Achromobacter arsenitoxydans SY8]|uniref:Uncharacterized protein n=1 Tax=Achromobacter arsenitoxydans SY8 TaxID=477184 RepID=H0FF29_9BURK|nr:hypothetical protein KYC_26977 [Achromobacter arsenitoxydans SY8]